MGGDVRNVAGAQRRFGIHWREFGASRVGMSYTKKGIPRRISGMENCLPVNATACRNPTSHDDACVGGDLFTGYGGPLAPALERVEAHHIECLPQRQRERRFGVNFRNGLRIAR